MTILLADDHVLIRDGIKFLLSAAYPLAAITVASDSVELLQKVPLEKWDVIVLDISMPPGDSGLESIRLIKEQFPKTPVVVLSMHPIDQYAVRAIKAGASGYLNKGEAGQELIKAINHVLSGRRYLGPEVALAMADTIEGIDNKPRSLEKLSDRELEVLKMLASGMPVADISKKLGLRSNTVSTFRSKIFEKMNFQNNVELVKYAVTNKLV
jgi:two-component system invasion response regulator UvrY